MSLLKLQYRPDPRRPILIRPTFWVLLAVAAVIAFFVLRFFWFPRQNVGTPQTVVVSVVDARTKKPVPITIAGQMYAGADPWKRKYTTISPNTMRIQWVERSAAATILVTSPGYQPFGMELAAGVRPQISIGMWPTSMTAVAPPTQPTSATSPAASN